jgi:predicted alpha/beta-hydrolase family hydrolase
MVGMCRRLVAAGFGVAALDYPYQVAGRRSPDRMERLVAAHREAYERVRGARDAVPVLIGKSMGGRIGSHVAVDTPGRVFLGYPLVAAGKTLARLTDHLEDLGPMLFVQGERDALAPLPLISAVVGRLPQARLEVIADADHGFRVPRRTGIDPAEMLDQIAGVVTAWLGGLAGFSRR